MRLGLDRVDLLLIHWPNPDITISESMAALGDTSSDVESALRAGVAVAAGTLTGAHDEEQLRTAGATHVVGSVSEFADLILRQPSSEEKES